MGKRLVSGLFIKANRDVRVRLALLAMGILRNA